MPNLIDISAKPDPNHFPGATFTIEGTIPKAQCTEAVIDRTNGTTAQVPNRLTDPGAFVGFVLAGKIATITVSPTGNTGNFTISSHSPDELLLVEDPGVSIGVVYYIHDGAELELQRNPETFAAFIRAAGYAHTIKGGKLYTDCPSTLLAPACSILWNPLT